jgi:phosphatidylserine synthase
VAARFSSSAHRADGVNMTRTTAALLGAAILAIIARVTVFDEGGTAGAWATSILFWTCLLAALVSAGIRAFGPHPPHDRIVVAQWAFGAACVVSFAAAGLVDTWVPNDIFLLSLAGLLVSTLLRSRARRP